MDTVLDRYGNEVEVRGVWFPAEMWVMTSMPDDVPIACFAVNIKDGGGVEWEDGVGLLDIIHNHKMGDVVEWGGKKYKIGYFKADFSAIMSGNKTLSCSAIKDDGELVCGWTCPDFRGSNTLYLWSLCFGAYLYETVHLDKKHIYWLVSINNVLSNKYNSKTGARIVGVINKDGEIFNKYQLDLSNFDNDFQKLKSIWMSKNIDTMFNRYLEEKRLVNVG